MKKLLALISALCCLVATTALATPYSPTQSELLSYSLLWTDDYGVERADTPNNDGLGGAEFSLKFNPITPHSASAFFGKNYASPIDLSSYDSFKVSIRNDNENPWKFELGLFDGVNGAGDSRTSAVALIKEGTGATLSIDFSGIDPSFLSNVKTVGFWVFEDVPIIGIKGNYDYVPEFGVAPVPEPGTMVLLGVGFLGLAIYGKRRRNA